MRLRKNMHLSIYIYVYMYLVVRVRATCESRIYLYVYIHIYLYTLKGVAKHWLKDLKRQVLGNLFLDSRPSNSRLIAISDHLLISATATWLNSPPFVKSVCEDGDAHEVHWLSVLARVRQSLLHPPEDGLAASR